ncbi:unnamed protein product, partial [Rotaria sp. Silwood1]
PVLRPPPFKSSEN